MAGQTVIVSVLADTKKFSRAFKNLSNEIGLSRLGQGFRNAGRRVVDFFKSGIRYTALFAAAMAGLALKGGFERMMNIEDAQAKLKGLGHDTRTIESVMDDALASVKGTAFGLDSAATAAASAMAAGIQPGQELQKYLGGIADAATIAGVDMNDMSAIFGKIATSGRAQTTEINQIADRGIPIWAALAEQYGVNQTELRKMVSAGEVDAQTFYNTMDELVGGAAQEAGNTTRGAFANMRAALSRTGAALLSSVFPMFKDAFSGITEWLDGVTERVGPMGEAFGEWISGVALPAVQDFGRWISGSLVPALKEFWEIVSGAVREAIQTVSGAFSEAGITAEGMGSSIKDSVIAAIQTLAPILANLITGMASLVGWLIKHRDIVLPVVAGLLSAVTAITALNKVIKIARAVQLAFNIVLAANPIMLVIAAVAALVTGLVYFFTQTETGRKIWAKAWGGIKAAAQAVGRWFTGTLVPWFRNAGRNVQNAWNAVVSFFRNIPGNIRRIFNNAINWLVSGGRNILSGLRTGATDRWTAVIDWFRTRPEAIKNWFSNAGNWLWSAGSNIISGFIDGIYSRWESVRNTLSNLTNLLPSWKGPADKDKKLLTGAGQLIIEGFINGLESEYGTVKRSLAGLTHLVSGTDMGTLDAPTMAPAWAGGRSGLAGAGGVTIEVHALMDGPEIGRRVARALDDWDRVNGAGRGGRR